MAVPWKRVSCLPESPGSLWHAAYQGGHSEDAPCLSPAGMFPIQRRRAGPALSVFTVVLMALALLLSGCAGPQPADTAAPIPQRFSTTYIGHMNTVVTLTAYCGSSREFDTASQAVRQILEQADRMYDAYTPDSALARLNGSVGEWVELPQELADLLRLCIQWQDQTQGANIAMGRVTRLWQAARHSGLLPSKDALDAAKGHISLSALELDGCRARLTDTGVSLDLGCVTKGYVADTAARRLKELGIQSFLLDCGTSTIRCSGSPPGRDGWSIALTNPDDILNLSGRPDPPAYLGKIQVQDCSLGVSGDYQQYFMMDGVSYSHLLDPQTLYPARNYRQVCVLVSGQAEEAAAADYLSTALFCLPPEESRQAAEALTGVECLWVLPDGTVETTDSFPLMPMEQSG